MGRGLAGLTSSFCFRWFRTLQKAGAGQLPRRPRPPVAQASSLVTTTIRAPWGRVERPAPIPGARSHEAPSLRACLRGGRAVGQLRIQSARVGALPRGVCWSSEASGRRGARRVLPPPRLRAFADWFPLSSPLSPSRTLSPQGLLSQSLCSLSHVRPADPEVGPGSVLRAPQATPVLSPECGPQQHPPPVSWQRPRTAAPPLASPACAGRPCGEDAAEHLSGAPHPPQHRHGSSS